MLPISRRGVCGSRQTGFQGLLKVFALLYQLLEDAMSQPDELRKLARWTELYDANDEMVEGTVPGFIRTMHTVVQATLDDIKPVLMTKPNDPGCLQELTRAFARVTRNVREARAGRLR